MTSSSYYTIGGSLEFDSPTYVARAADDELFQRVSSFELCYVLTTRQMGKSSLMIRTAKRLIDAGWRAAIIDLTTLGSGKDVTAEKWYYGVCEEIARSLELDFDFGAWWDQQQRLPLSQRFVRFLRDVVLKHNTQPVVIFVDEIDSTLNLDFSDDFFAAIRACYNARTTEPDFRRLTFVLLGVASPSDLMKDRSRTPFNIGSRVELTDFTAEEARPLAQGLADDDAARRLLLSRVMKLVGGHPYLLRLAFYWLANHKGSLKKLDAVAADVEGPFADVLSHLFNMVLNQKNKRMRVALKAVLDRGICDSGQREEDESLFQKLCSAGLLVGPTRDQARFRNDVYRRFFELRLQ